MNASCVQIESKMPALWVIEPSHSLFFFFFLFGFVSRPLSFFFFFYFPPLEALWMLLRHIKGCPVVSFHSLFCSSTRSSSINLPPSYVPCCAVLPIPGSGMDPFA